MAVQVCHDIIQHNDPFKRRFYDENIRLFDAKFQNNEKDLNFNPINRNWFKFVVENVHFLFQFTY